MTARTKRRLVHVVGVVQGDQHIASFGERNLPAHQAGVAALGNDADLGLGADPHDAGDLAGARGFEQKRRLPHEPGAPFAQERSKLVGIVRNPEGPNISLGRASLPRRVSAAWDSIHGKEGLEHLVQPVATGDPPGALVGFSAREGVAL